MKFISSKKAVGLVKNSEAFVKIIISGNEVSFHSFKSNLK